MFKLASNLSQVRIDAQLDEADIGKIRFVQEVSFDVDAYRGETFIGRVALVKIQSETKGNLVTYPVLVEASNPPDKDHPSGKLLPGMTAGLKLVVDQKTPSPGYNPKILSSSTSTTRLSRCTRLVSLR